MNWSVLAPAIIVAGVCAFALLERAFPYDRGQRMLREGFWTDLIFYTLIQSYVLALLIAQLTRWIDSSTGWSRLHLVSDWPLAGQVAFFVVTHDLYIYWFHRWQHSSPILWRLHEAHHSARSVDWLASTRSHAVEILINQTIEFAPMVLLGASPEVPLIKGVIGALWGMYIHANIGVRTGRLQYVINGPEAHRWHHALDADAYGKNLATKLSIWDRLFGTAWLPDGRKPTGYGLTDVEFPTNYYRQHLFALRPLEPSRGAEPPVDGRDPGRDGEPAVP
jgi:sterol desaturase/sphingolipid hydroxylase (fatty acid hydroxylase superfamily)